jgi:hypothetical protein
MTLLPQKRSKVKLIAAIMVARERLIEEAISVLSPSYGVLEFTSPVFPFTHSRYYAGEMGEALVKTFCSFRGVLEPEEIVARKLEAMACEQSFLREGTSSRQVNVDPGYLDEMKLVMATTKNASHRVYIGSGVHGDVELVYGHGTFAPLEWTYPDYREPVALEFFSKVRREYLAELRERERSGKENTPSA